MFFPQALDMTWVSILNITTHDTLDCGWTGIMNQQEN